MELWYSVQQRMEDKGACYTKGHHDCWCGSVRKSNELTENNGKIWKHICVDTREKVANQQAKQLFLYYMTELIFDKRFWFQVILPKKCLALFWSIHRKDEKWEEMMITSFTQLSLASTRNPKGYNLLCNWYLWQSTKYDFGYTLIP